MRIYKITRTLTSYMTEAQVREGLGPKESDLLREPALANESVEAMIRNQAAGEANISDMSWEPHCLPNTATVLIELVDMPESGLTL
jgi:hypothetical protein